MILMFRWIPHWTKYSFEEPHPYFVLANKGWGSTLYRKSFVMQGIVLNFQTPTPKVTLTTVIIHTPIRPS